MFLTKFFGDSNNRFLKKLQPLVQEINRLEPQFQKFKDEDFPTFTEKLKKKIKAGEKLDILLPSAFAACREASRRTLGERPYDVQLLAGIVLHQGKIAEQKTGEGKTLSATMPVYLNALMGQGVHVVTVNDYLARRDTEWMGPIYHLLGLSVSCIQHEKALQYQGKKEERHINTQTEMGDETDSRLQEINRQQAYACDVTYGTNNEFGFDYLRDNMVWERSQMVQRELSYAIVDEIDSILIDEARTPLIISAPDTDSTDKYYEFARIVPHLKENEDYNVDEKMQAVALTDAGISKLEKILGVKNIYEERGISTVHHLEQALRAYALFKQDRDYVVRDGEVIIVDQFTGRLMPGRRWSVGIHQAVEAKEAVKIQEESRTFAQITIQNYFRLYKKIAGMTGTAQTSAEEFYKVYGLEVVSVPPNKPLIRKDRQDVIYKNLDAKYRAIAKDIKQRHAAGQPVLIGTVSIEKNEILSKYLKDEGIPHEILNAKNHEREGAIIAQAGKLGAVTVATNMAGRGVDIILGGNPSSLEESKKVKELGGLHVVGTERHEARRIDNQLRGRSGRQGDPGSSQFYLSLEDDLMRIFGGDRIRGLMESFKVPEDMPIENKMVTRAVVQAQTKVEGFNFDARKHLLEYDDVLNKQRLGFYGKRQKILNVLNEEEVRSILEETVFNYLDKLEQSVTNEEELKKLLKDSDIGGETIEEARRIVKERIKNYKNINFVKRQFLVVLDFLWMNHLEDIEALVESVRLRAYGQKDPLVEYRRESKILFDSMMANFEAWIFNNIFKLEKISEKQSNEASASSEGPKFKDVGRNDPCPCGSGKKYKKCHGR